MGIPTSVIYRQTLMLVRAFGACVAPHLLIACATAGTDEVDRWEVGTTESGCRAVSYGYLVDIDQLAEIVGSRAQPTRYDGDDGMLQIEVIDCAEADRGASRAEARVSVVLEPSSMPVQLAGSGGYDAYILHVAHKASPSLEFIREHDIPTLRGDVTLNVVDETDPANIEATLTFDEGSVRLVSSFHCDTQTFTRDRLMIGTGSQYSAFFGTESGEHCSSAENQLEISGLTPFLGLDMEPAGAIIFSNLKWKYTVWHDVGL